MSITDLLAVAGGGAIGALGRWWLARSNNDWPTGTLLANLLGCLGLGALLAVSDDPRVLTGIGVGLLGGLTTFSTFAVEAAVEPSDRAWGYTIGSVVGGGLALLLGAGIGGLVI